MADANPHPSAATMTDEERAKVKEERERRKKEKEAEAAAKKAKQEAAAASKTAGGGKADSAVADEDIVWPKVSYITPELPSEIFGDYVMVQSQGTTGRTWTRLQELDASKVGSLVWIRSRVHNARGKGNSCFLVLRSNMYTAQVAMFKSDSISKDFIKFCSCLSRESVVDVLGTIQAADVKSCTQSQIEIVPQRVYCVSRAYHMMPFTVDDVARSESEIAASEAKDIQTAYKRVGQDTRLDNRCIDLRAPAQNAIMRINSGVCDLWREACKANGFVEIHTPKMIAGASEGGAAVFKLQYFQQQACLAQSPQLYKQMSICSDFERVFEIGPVFRAETSNSHRHLTEFTGLDIEMEIKEHYFEALDMLEVILTHIFHGLQTQYAHEIDVASQQYEITPFQFKKWPERNVRLTYIEAINILREAGEDLGDYDDINTAQEKKLGGIVKQRYGTDFFSVHRFPDTCRPFYTMPAHDDKNWTNSYDIYMRGEEICSGAQRIHDSDMLTANAIRKGIEPSTIAAYIEAFRFGASPHGGGGVGLERVTMCEQIVNAAHAPYDKKNVTFKCRLFLGVGNVRKSSMFPRDPARLTP